MTAAVRPLRVAAIGVLAASFLAIAGIAAPAAVAKGTGHASSTSSPLTLVSESSWLNPVDPPWCMSEDDYDIKTYSGSLSGAASTTQQLCGTDSDYYDGMYWTAGGIGIESNVSVVGQLNDLSITAPDGTSHHGVLMSQSTSKGVTTTDYAVCYVPMYSVSNDGAGSPLPGGTWQIALSGQISKATWVVDLEMTDATFQQQHCPVSQQNLSP